MFWNKKTIWNLTVVLMAVVGLLVVGNRSANADFAFGTPTNLGPTVNSSANEICPSISVDGLQLYFTDWGVHRPGGYGDNDIWVTTRTTTDDPWGEPVNLGPTVNTSYGEGAGSISADGLSLFLGSGRPGGYGGPDIWVTTRETKDDPWGEPANLGPTVNSSSDEIAPSISADSLQLYFSGWRKEFTRPGGYGMADMWVTRRATIDDDWGEPVNLGPTVNSSDRDKGPSISADGLSLFFCSHRPGGPGHWDLWLTTRATKDNGWSAPVNLGPNVNSSAWDEFPSISADGSTLFFTSNRPGGYGGYDLWQVSIVPVVDFNGDGIVDCADMCIMIDHWQTDEPLCDIGPMPWGDGIVDVQDLVVLAEYLTMEVVDPNLVAH